MRVRYRSSTVTEAFVWWQKSFGLGLEEIPLLHYCQNEHGPTALQQSKVVMVMVVLASIAQLILKSEYKGERYVCG
ncbi:hypothetical protein OFB58_25275, partial [Escherichia coli]|nr:hypothetical protein [Escherichia coli]